MAALATLAPIGLANAQQVVTFATPDAESLDADVYGKGDRGVLLIGHGGYSNRTTWRAPARILMAAGYRVLVFDTRAAVALKNGTHTSCLYDAACMAVDVLAGVRRLRRMGATSVAVIGGSAGAGAAAQAAILAEVGEIDSLVLLAPMAIPAPEGIKGRKLFITARQDLGSDNKPRLPGILAQYRRAPEPKELVTLDGSAHGQRMFESPDGEELWRHILRFLSTPAADSKQPPW